MRTIKLVIIGDSGVGKTSLRTQYITGKFSTGYRATIGTDFITKTLPHYQNPDETVTLQIWDTAGQERFSSLSSAFFRGADAALLMFDVNRPETLHALMKWWETFKAYAPVPDEEAEDFCCVVVGNKVDMTENVDVLPHRNANGSASGVTSESDSGTGRLRVSKAEAERFLDELIPKMSRDDPEDDRCMTEYEEGEVDDPLISDANPDHSRQSTARFMRRAISGFSLHSVTSSLSHRKSRDDPEEREDVGDRTNHDPEVDSPPRVRSQSISIQPSNGNAHPFRRLQKSRSSEAASSILGGTMTTVRTTQTIYHTPSSSIFDQFESAPSSPFHAEHGLPPTSFSSSSFSSFMDGDPSTPHNNPHRTRRMTSTSASSSSSAPTITPSLFMRTQASHSAAPTPPTPIESSASSSSLPSIAANGRGDDSKHHLLPQQKRRDRQLLPSRPERGPKLFFTSAKTGEGVGPVFEHISRRVCMSWAYSEALESLGINHDCENGPAPVPTRSNTLRLRLGLFNGSSESRSVWLRERMKGGASCCGS